MIAGGSETRKKYLAYAAGLVALLVVVLAIVSGLVTRSSRESASTTTDQPSGQATEQSPESPAGEPSPSSSEQSEQPSPAQPDGGPSPEQPAIDAPPAVSSGGQSLSVRTDTILPAYQDVPVQESVTIENTVTARVASMAPTVSDGTGPGEIDGPALAVTIEVRNDSGGVVNLNTAGVTLSLGPDLSPASPLPTQSLAAPFSGELASGQTATGTYVFLVPEGSPQDIRVEVTYGGDNPVIAFVGTRP